MIRLQFHELHRIQSECCGAGLLSDFIGQRHCPQGISRYSILQRLMHFWSGWNYFETDSVPQANKSDVQLKPASLLVLLECMTRQRGYGCGSIPCSLGEHPPNDNNESLLSCSLTPFWWVI